MVKACRFLLLTGALLAAVAQAQTPAAEAARQADVLQRQNEERIRRDLEKALPQPPPPFPGISMPPPAVDASAAGPACHPIDDIVISGAPHLSASSMSAPGSTPRAISARGRRP